MDVSLAEYCLWSNETQRIQVQEVMTRVLEQNGIDCDTSIAYVERGIEEFKAEVDEKWYEEKRDKIVIMGNESCYECLDSNNNTWYVGEYGHQESNSNDYSRSHRRNPLYDIYAEVNTISGVHNVYDANGQKTTTGAFSRTGGTITCGQSFTVKKIREATQYSDSAHSTLQQKFDTQYYAPIVSEIDEEIAAIKKRKEEEKADAIAVVCISGETPCVQARMKRRLNGTRRHLLLAVMGYNCARSTRRGGMCPRKRC